MEDQQMQQEKQQVTSMDIFLDVYSNLIYYQILCHKYTFYFPPMKVLSLEEDPLCPLVLDAMHH
jgi:hypothetical protein